MIKGRKHKTGLFFGSFNPIHVGHLILANYFLEYTDIDSLEFVVSPQNPLKPSASLAPQEHRYQMLKQALALYPELPIGINTIEFCLPKPSYTIDTLTVLREQNPDSDYLILMGADSIASIEKWKDYKKLLSEYEVCVYPRIGFDLQDLCRKYGVEPISKAPQIEISATFIRTAIKEGYNLATYLPYGIWDYIKKHGLYNAEVD